MGEFEMFALYALFNFIEKRLFLLSCSSLILEVDAFSRSRWKWMKFMEQYGIKQILNNIFCFKACLSQIKIYISN
jgi:hypothetical protein